MDTQPKGVTVRHMKKVTPGRYDDFGAPDPPPACADCLCRRCAADCELRPRREDCSDVCVGFRYVVSSCTRFLTETAQA